MSDPYDSASHSLPSPHRSPAEALSCPYVPGATFIAHRHVPPAPFGGSYSEIEISNQEDLQCSTQLDWCVAHPPAEGATFFDDAHSFTVKSAIRTGENCGAQLIFIDTGLVAKIYDPMFYSYGEQPDLKIDVSSMADSDYSNEAAAYSELQGTPAQGSIVPEYHGSWTMEIMSVVRDEHITRRVRMILMDYVPGIRMLDIKPEYLTAEERENVMIKVIEADYDLRYAGVRHDDLSPRNIIITTPSNLADPQLRLVLIDFAFSFVFRINLGTRPKDKYRNPLFEWSWPSRWGSYGWISPCREETIKRMWELFGDGRKGKYVKVQRDPSSKLGAPIEEDWEINE
ncbi:uncharacterized protein EKO05_0010396 [Ascochyta rabiei]|uniref:Oxidoreductase n=1 Tax=Didymella rabiei TaxID=5454 RepID=A0A163MBK8_DIDRA|nr:uncharacterized protein EKO05_0010396 [Ascochyta rabiei]KZM18891.1 oxidoreductase [Ascochyta rabiei]KZM28567.1 oxidoreductase [Ascochyta rabiei]UPX20154.1 hypothetical protein EKO05_0010396 [Ascochyta rabiei]